MNQHEKNLLAFLRESFSVFFEKEIELILTGISERSLCCRLSVCMENLKEKYKLENYYADTEYNRKQEGQVKTILNHKEEVISITCDLIFHSRGESVKNDNLIAVEMKKVNRLQEEKIKDKNRLKALTKENYDNVWSNDGKTHPEHVCGYIWGIYVEIDHIQRKFIFECYYKGNLFREEIGDF